MGRGYQGQGHRPSSGLIQALHQGWVRRGVCVCPMRGTGGGGGGVMVAENCSGGGGAAVDKEEVNDGESKASVCLVDHVLHGNCPDVMILRSQRRTVAYYSTGE